MSNKLLPILLLLLCPLLLKAQVDEELKQDVINTGFLHRPLPLDYSKSFETFGLSKKLLSSTMLAGMESLDKWTHKGIGGISLTAERKKEGEHSLRLVAPSTYPEFLGWGIGFGTSMASYEVGGKNWEQFNRIRFFIYPNCEGARSIYLNLYLENEGAIKVPDKYEREGFHENNLVNGQWNECFIEMTELPRDKVTKLSFAIEVFGKERTMGDSLKFDIDAVTLEKVANPEVVTGWIPAENRIIHSTTGYGTGSVKSAIVSSNIRAEKFQLIDQKTKEVAFEGNIRPEKTQLGNFRTIDFTEFSNRGEYFLRAGDISSKPFYIHPDIWENSAWRILNFIFCERCGYPVPGKHGACHSDLNGIYKGKLFALNGGWHDAADMSEQVMQSAEIVYSLLEMSKRAKGQLHQRLLEEAEWGIDMILKTRLGDGYRAQTWGTNLWTDGFIGTKDDSTSRRRIRIHNRAFENFIFAGVEAYAAMTIEGDTMLRNNLRKVALEDFHFAKQRFDSLGFNELSGGGGGDHAAMGSNSQYMANISYTATLLFQLTAEKYYADIAASAIGYALKCQRTDPLNDRNKTSGFFYRDTTRQSIVHFTHQSRDHAYMQALTALCITQPSHPDYAKWEKAIKLYGQYLKNIMRYVAPYGMVPSGVYNINEIRDSANFYRVQVGISGGVEKDFKEQLQNGVKLDNEHWLRVFPVWFSFRGNAAVHLATGKAAALCGKFLKDKELMNIAEEQLFWLVGKNPFGQSLIWGEGSNYPQLYVALPGETVGGIPVGMQSRFNGDLPYWPQFNTATYKEVWGAPAAKWLSLIAEF